MLLEICVHDSCTIECFQSSFTLGVHRLKDQYRNLHQGSFLHPQQQHSAKHFRRYVILHQVQRVQTSRQLYDTGTRNQTTVLTLTRCSAPWNTIHCAMCRVNLIELRFRRNIQRFYTDGRTDGGQVNNITFYLSLG